jgi:lipoprotein-anchoring transpeptidase ErfK/SrfK
MSFRFRALTLVFAFVIVLGVFAVKEPYASGAALKVPVSTATVTLLAPARVHTYPGASSPITSVVAPTRPLTGSPTTLPVIATATAEDGPWVEVRLPQRPDGAVGWISTAATRAGSDPWFIRVRHEDFTASIYKVGKLIKTFPVIVGKPSTPTPVGTFFVAEVINEGSGTVSGPYALATSAYSKVLQEFEGGPGQIALHGRVGLDDPIGSASSHGCVRFLNQDIVWMAAHIPAGTLVSIR